MEENFGNSRSHFFQQYAAISLSIHLILNCQDRMPSRSSKSLGRRGPETSTNRLSERLEIPDTIEEQLNKAIHL